MLTFQSSNKLQTLLRFVKTRPQARQHIFVLNDEFLFQAKKEEKSAVRTNSRQAAKKMSHIIRLNAFHNNTSV